MGFEKVLEKIFPGALGEVGFVQKTYSELKPMGFRSENTIVSVCICRDEISQSVRSIIKHVWGEAFNLSSLAGMFFAGKTGIKAAMHHAPITDGKERYVFYGMSHIAIDSEGRIGTCRRTGRQEESVACGALAAFQEEMAGGRLDVSLDIEDVEQSLIKMRLIKKITYGRIPELLELTKITLSAIQEDLENTLKGVVDTEKSDYALITGIQVHGPDGNYVWPSSSYAIVNRERHEIKL
ncbi:MAG: hypothetical protein Q8J64_03915 [Thermodesulfovibrionales bacterium]|nr:hypothetical protein [Thermodesulfovibrionales bacterium]